MGHPAVGDHADAGQRTLGAAGIGLSLRQPLGIGREPDRTRVLDRLRLERDVGEIDEAAGERLVVLAPEVAQHTDVLDHPLTPLVRRDAQRRGLRLPERPGAAAGAGHQPGTAVRQDVERGPFVGEDQRIAQRERAHASRPQQHPFGAPGDRGQQRQGIESAIDEQRVPAPDRIHHRRGLDGIRQGEQVARAAKPHQHAAVR